MFDALFCNYNYPRANAYTALFAKRLTTTWVIGLCLVLYCFYQRIVNLTNSLIESVSAHLTEQRNII